MNNPKEPAANGAGNSSPWQALSLRESGKEATCGTALRRATIAAIVLLAMYVVSFYLMSRFFCASTCSEMREGRRVDHYYFTSSYSLEDKLYALYRPLIRLDKLTTGRQHGGFDRPIRSFRPAKAATIFYGIFACCYVVLAAVGIASLAVMLARCLLRLCPSPLVSVMSVMQLLFAVAAVAYGMWLVIPVFGIFIELWGD